MTEIISTKFSHNIQNFLTFNPIHVAKNKVSRKLDSFFYKGWHWHGSIR